MSSRKRKEAPMPATAAGLLRFFEDESKGIKIRPELALGLGVALMIMVLLARFLIPL